MQLAAAVDGGNGICLACTYPASRLTLTIIQDKIWDQKLPAMKTAIEDWKDVIMYHSQIQFNAAHWDTKYFS